MVKILDVVIAGLLMGGIYALIAVGLSLQYGVARVLNIAHGEFIMLGAFITWTLYAFLGINPLVSLAVSGPLIFIIGFILYRTLFARLRISAATPASYEGTSMLACFALLFIIQNVAILIWGAEIKGYSFLATSVSFWGAKFAANRLITLGFAMIVGFAFYLFMARSRLGKAISAKHQSGFGCLFCFRRLHGRIRRFPYQHVLSDPTNNGARVYHDRPCGNRFRRLRKHPWEFYRRFPIGACWQYCNLYPARPFIGGLLSHLHAYALGKAGRSLGTIEK